MLFSVSVDFHGEAYFPRKKIVCAMQNEKVASSERKARATVPIEVRTESNPLSMNERSNLYEIIYCWRTVSVKMRLIENRR